MVTQVAQRLLETAVDCLDGVSAAGLKVDEVARRAGVNKRMIYHHFGNKAGLVEAARDSQAAVLAGARLVSAETRQAILALYPTLQPSATRTSHARLRQAARVILARLLEETAQPDDTLAGMAPGHRLTFLAELASIALLGWPPNTDKVVMESEDLLTDLREAPKLASKPSFRLSSVSRPKAPGAS